MQGARELKPEELRYRCDPERFSFRSTEEVEPLEGIIGQERAVTAIDFGLAVRRKGYNIFVAGPTGTGRGTYVRAAVTERAKLEKPPDDWCYLYNFGEPDRPLAVRLPPGVGARLQQDMEDLLEDLRSLVPRAFESNEYERQKSTLVGEMQGRIEEILSGLEKKAQTRGFSIKHSPAGLAAVPLKEDGAPLEEEEFEKLPDAEKELINDHGRQVHTWVSETIHEVRGLEKEAKSRLKDLDQQVGLYAAGPLLDRLKDRYRRYGRVAAYLDALKDDISKSLEIFRSLEEGGGAGGGGAAGAGEAGAALAAALFPRDGRVDRELYFNRFRVNLFVNNTNTGGAPVVYEPHPTYYNLFGKIEYQGQMGNYATDFSMIRAGAIHRANGGYLIVQAGDLLADPYAWEALKRALQNERAVVENIGEQYRLAPAASLKPEPVPLDVKVILIGNSHLYQLLYHYEEAFRKFFKIKAEFDSEMDASPEHLDRYAAFISAVCRRDGLGHFGVEAVARVVEYSMYLVSSQEKLSTRFNEVVEIIYEADAWAEAEGAKIVAPEHVQRAIDAKIARSNQVEEKMQEYIEKGLIHIDTEGAVVGQVNGLSVIDLGDYSFGRPSRITAQTYLGEEGVINIEREVKMSGRIHDKGVLILSGFMGARFAQDKPLTLSASLCFEQSYEGVEGDSASSAELYALLSSLAGVPIRQNLAVTGSVDQRGLIQPIGGVNQKIEGFYEVCRARGLTGEQGVLIPYSNVKDLMLREEIVEAVREGKFHIYAVETVDQGIELLSGKAAGGERGEDGVFPEGSVNWLVDGRLRELAEAYSRFGGAGKEGDGGGGHPAAGRVAGSRARR